MKNCLPCVAGTRSLVLTLAETIHHHSDHHRYRMVKVGATLVALTSLGYGIIVGSRHLQTNHGHWSVPLISSTGQAHCFPHWTVVHLSLPAYCFKLHRRWRSRLKRVASRKSRSSHLREPGPAAGLRVSPTFGSRSRSPFWWIDPLANQFLLSCILTGTNARHVISHANQVIPISRSPSPLSLSLSLYVSFFPSLYLSTQCTSLLLDHRFQTKISLPCGNLMSWLQPKYSEASFCRQIKVHDALYDERN